MPQNTDVLVVCDRFDTGYDNDCICLVGVDRQISSNDKLVQIYSRANRRQPSKPRHVSSISKTHSTCTVCHELLRLVRDRDEAKLMKELTPLSHKSALPHKSAQFALCQEQFELPSEDCKDQAAIACCVWTMRLRQAARSELPHTSRMTGAGGTAPEQHSQLARHGL